MLIEFFNPYLNEKLPPYDPSELAGDHTFPTPSGIETRSLDNTVAGEYPFSIAAKYVNGLNEEPGCRFI